MKKESLINEVRRLAGSKLADYLNFIIEEKNRSGKIAVSVLLAGGDCELASEKSGLSIGKVKMILSGLRRKGGYKDIRYKSFLPRLSSGDYDISVLQNLYSGAFEK